jgi:hypothetical protein
MDERVTRARRYRYRAEEMRTMSGGWSNPETLRILNELARDYDRMAEAMEVPAERDGNAATMIA